MKTDEVCDRYLETFGRRYFWGYLRLILSVSWINTRKFYESVANSIARKWLKTPDKMTSWEFFDYLLEKANVVGTPGSGFGPSGEGYFRLTAFGSYENTVKALERIKAL